MSSTTNNISSGAFLPVQQGYANFKKGLGFVAKEAADAGTANAVAKFARRLFEFLAIFDKVAPFSAAPAHFFKGFSEFFKVLGVFKSTHDVLTAKSVAKLASSVLGLTSGVLSIVKLMDTFKWINLGKVSAAIGKIPIFGAVSVIPLGTFISWIEGTKAAVDIGIAVGTLINLAKKIDHMNEKRNFWATPLDTDKCAVRIHKYKEEGEKLKVSIKKLEEKQDSSNYKVSKWRKKKIAAIARNEAKLSKQNKIQRCFTKTLSLPHKIVPNKVDRKLRKWDKIDKDLLATLNKKKAEYKQVVTKELSWKKIEKRLNLTPTKKALAKFAGDIKQVETLQTQKLEKWNFKKSNARLEQLKQGMSIVLNGAVIALVAGSTVLFFVGLFGTPLGAGVLPILLPSLGLAIAGIGLGMHFFKRYKGKEIKKVETPEFIKEDKLAVEKIISNRAKRNADQRSSSHLNDRESERSISSDRPASEAA
ncbi:hypothetical protein PHSC3_002067 [Chlamydiales bacterium STE3]|nr:hypothetical protein PHSC3_002067 [Chlamydiales bacterium STE3]